MRGLEPPPDFSDTDLNQTDAAQMGPVVSEVSNLWGFADASDASDDTTVAKLLPRIDALSVSADLVQLVRFHVGGTCGWRPPACGSAA
jgi:hypothetical protein